MRLGFYDVGKAFYYDKDNPEGLQEMYRRWGLGKKTGIDLAGEADGRVPDRKWKQSHFKNWSSSDRAWNPGDMTNIAIGQGDILVTPLQMSCVYAGIANGALNTPLMYSYLPFPMMGLRMFSSTTTVNVGVV